MSQPPSPTFFHKEASQIYDERNSKLAAISDCLHFLIRLVLNGLPTESRVLCVGVGTGAEILSLARAYPKWRFVGVDPSEHMLEVCRANLTKAGFADRCDLVHGYVQDLPAGGDYDAVLSVLVAHFVARKDRADFFHGLTSRLRSGGKLVNAEIGYDLNSVSTEEMIEQWKKIQALMGGTPESLAAVPQALREILTVLPPEETERLLRESGIEMPMRFFQALMIGAWVGTKR